MFGDKKIKEIMHKKFIQVKKDDTIKSIINKLKGSANIAIVYDKNGPVGDIDELNLLKLTMNIREIPTNEIIDMGFGIDMDFLAKSAKDIMDPIAISVTPETTVTQTVMLMLKENVKSMPVMEKGKVLGVVSNDDIVKKFLKWVK